MSDDKVFMTEIVPALSKIADYKLNGSNYLDWSRKIRVYLRSVEKDDHLSQDPPTDETKKAWMRDDARLFLQIINSIDNEVVGLVNHCEFVKELVDYLEYPYSGKGYVSRIYEVCKAFYLPQKEAKTLTTYFMEFKKNYEELNMLLPFSTDIKVQQAQREQMAIMSFLAGLPSEFETAKSQILSDSEITSLKDVFSLVLRTESTPSNQQTNVLVAKGEEKNETTSTYSDSQSQVAGLGIVPTCAPLANAQLEDRNADSLCGSPIVFSSTLRSFYNRENTVDSRSAEESCKEADHGQAELRTSKVEWVEQYQLGVFVTLTVLPSGKKGLKRVRFSRKKFTEKEAKKWWEENQLSVYKKYETEHDCNGGSC